MRLRLFLVGRPISSYFYNGRRRAMPRLSSEWWRSSTARRATVAIACCLQQAKVAIRLAVQALCTIAAHNPARLPAETRSARFYDKSGGSTRHTRTSPVRSTALATLVLATNVDRLYLSRGDVETRSNNRHSGRREKKSNEQSPLDNESLSRRNQPGISCETPKIRYRSSRADSTRRLF